MEAFTSRLDNRCGTPTGMPCNPMPTGHIHFMEESCYRRSWFYGF